MTDNGTGTEVATAATTRESFGSNEVTRTAETAITAAAKHAEASVNAMYIMAERKPRDIMEVRSRLLKDCERPRFAAEAEYSLPRGGKTIKGPSIRFAEAALRALRNVHVKTIVTYEDDDKRVGEVVAIDLEANIPLSSGFSIDKTVERKSLNGREVVVRTRVNSEGKEVHIIRATEADVLMKQESIVSRIRRNLILQLLPGDILDEAIETCRSTMHNKDAADPFAAAKKLCDSFEEIGITAAQLREFLGHSADSVTPDEAAELRGVHTMLRAKEATWDDIIRERKGSDGETKDDEKAERISLLQKISTLRVRDFEAYKATLADAGIKGVTLKDLDTDVLRRIHTMLEAGHGKKASEQTVDSTAKPVTSEDGDDGGSGGSADTTTAAPADDHLDLDKELDDFANRDANAEEEARS